ncbi:MAG: PQQ-dependent sugar dehydrogenase [Bacteroidetes bacterium]|nr:PQQ-dependent sugar dehydrogenase [Bacteroidota bacterium]
MKQKITFLCIYSIFSLFQSQAQVTNPLASTSDSNIWSVTKITGNNAIERPYEMIYGPDHRLWITERRDDVVGINGGKRIVRIDTTGANKTTMINFGNKVHTTAGQDGVLGIVAHPDLYFNPATTTNNYVYVSYTYSINGTDSGRRLRIARLIYNNNNGTLTEDTSLGANAAIIEGLPASNDHNSGKLAIGPDLKLYYTLGDQGNNQFSRNCLPIRARELPVNTTDFSRYEGKLLRLNLDGTIPADNPILNGVRTHVWNYGHRNMQGLAISSFGTVYSTEHGDRVDDEFNLMVAAKDYGWPNVAGLRDDKGYEFTNNSLTTTCGGTLTVAQATQTETQSFPVEPVDFVEPLSTMGTGSATIPTGSNSTWPTIAPAGLALYENTEKKIKDWGDFVLIPGLKFNTIQLGRLSMDGLFIIEPENDILPIEPEVALFPLHTANSRFRQIVVSPNGVSFYYVTDNNSAADPGSITKLNYIGPLEPTLSNEDFALSQDTFKLYPNPAKNKFSLRFDSNAFTKASLQIVDISGRIVKSFDQVQTNQAIDISSLRNGLYLVNITDQNQRKAVKKLVVVN